MFCQVMKSPAKIVHSRIKILKVYMLVYPVENKIWSESLRNKGMVYNTHKFLFLYTQKRAQNENKYYP
jgi:hypothetical protein